MPRKPSEIQVLIPYSQLLNLLNASSKVDELTKEVRQLREQQRLLRGQFVELMEAFREIKD